MAKTDAVWGIDIGQCALKALRCRPHEDPSRITVEAFDYIEYPKILSQPEADPVELVREAIALFLSRNSVRGDRVAISVSGQNGLARFIKLPPVEAKKIPDIVKYEARQQIPFALEDVIWDYQQMAGGAEEEGFALETEVGLFAMKREHVFRALKPFDDAKIEVDVIQLTPLALYNYVTFDQLKDLPPPEEVDPENPPESILVLSLGTDTTDLVVTNGYKVWQRSIPLGGNHFTRALTKEMKLTFAKAEHLKRNATRAEDPKAVFQAMRPVFTDLVTEIDRSVRFFSGIDRNAKIGRALALGNAMKLPGLQKYLSQNLGLEMQDLGAYRGLSGPAVVNSPAFKDNMLAFGVCYGLCLQGLNRSKLHTNLVPREIVQERTIREKKPWVVAAVAAVMVGLCLSFFGSWRAWAKVNDDGFKGAFQSAKAVDNQSKGAKASYTAAETEFKRVSDIDEHLRTIGERRVIWAEFLAALNDALPKNKDATAPVSKRDEIHIDSIDCEQVPDLKEWFAGIRDKWQEGRPGTPAAAGAPTPSVTPPPAPSGSAPNGAAPADAAGGDPGPQGEGWVIEIRGHHFHNDRSGDTGAQYVRKNLMDVLEKANNVHLGDGTWSMKELGIGYPALIYQSALRKVDLVNPNEAEVIAGAGGGAAPAAAQAGADKGPPPVEAQRFDFVLQFCWKETPSSKRQENRRAAKEAAPVAAARPSP